ncbi:MAG: hypothetical protein AVDCRST_MAG71-961, partial [uncultured Lysobacter sp.]
CLAHSAISSRKVTWPSTWARARTSGRYVQRSQRTLPLTGRLSTVDCLQVPLSQVKSRCFATPTRCRRTGSWQCCLQSAEA